MKAQWCAADGYVGRDRPKYTEIDIDEIAERVETEDEAEKALAEWIQEDFEQRVSWSCWNMEELIAAVMKRREEIAKES